MFLKDLAVNLLVEGNVEEFNKCRPNDQEGLLDLSEADFSEVSLDGVDFSYTDLSGVNFSEADIKDASFANADLTSANFSRATIEEADFSHAVLNGTSFVSATCTATFDDADLSGADFSDGNFEESDFSASENMSMCKFDEGTIWPDNMNLPDDFDTTYSADLSRISDEDDSTQPDYY